MMLPSTGDFATSIKETGRDIGAVVEYESKGNVQVPLVGEIGLDSAVKPSRFELQTDDRFVNRKITGGVIEGRTVKCIYADNDWVTPSYKSTYRSAYVNSDGIPQLKANTQYLYVVEVSSNTLDGDYWLNYCSSSKNCKITNSIRLKAGETGIFKHVVTTLDSTIFDKATQSIISARVSEGTVDETKNITFRRCLLEITDSSIINGFVPFGVNSTKATLSNNGIQYPLFDTLESKMSGKVLELNKCGSVADTLEILEDGSGILTQRLYRHKFKSSDVTYINSGIEGEDTFYFADVSLDLLGIPPMVAFKGFSTCPMAYTSADSWSAPNFVGLIVSDKFGGRYRFYRCGTTLAEFKAYVEGVEVVSVLQTPIVTHIPSNLLLHVPCSIFLQKDCVQSLTYNAKAIKGLGGVVKKVADIKALYNDYTADLCKGTPINIYYTCGTGNCKKSMLYISQVKVNKAKTLITIEALDKFSYDQTNKVMPIKKNTDLITYESAIFSALGYEYLIDDNVVNPNLALGYPRSGKVGDTLAAIAEANNALIDFEDIIAYGVGLPFDLPSTFCLPTTYGYISPGLDIRLHVKKFGFASSPDDTMNEDTELIDFELDNDNADQYSDVKVNLFFPSSGEQKSLGKVTATVPGSVTDYSIGKIDFGNTMIPQLLELDGMIDISDYSIGSDSFSFSVNNPDVLVKTINAEMYGMSIGEATLKDTDTGSNVKQISNMYIQSASVYDTEIFKHPNCTLKTFGNPIYEVGDTIRCGDYDVLILEENLVFSGGLKSTLKGVAKEYE